MPPFLLIQYSVLGGVSYGIRKEKDRHTRNKSKKGIC